MPWRDQSGPGFRIPDPRAPIVSLAGSWCIRGTAKSHPDWDPLVPLTHQDPSDLRSKSWSDHPKGMTLNLNNVIWGYLCASGDFQVKVKVMLQKKFELAHVITWTWGQVRINVTSAFNHCSQNWPHKLQSDTCNLENFENTRAMKYLCYLNCDLIVVTSVNNCNISFILKELFTLFFNYSGVRRKGKSPTRWNRGSIYCNWNLLVWLSKLPTFLSSRAWNIRGPFWKLSLTLFSHARKSDV